MPVSLLFGATIFVSACLLFSVQPMVAKMLLPLLGGSAAVWNTCLVFFQAMLLAGYAYAHFGFVWLRPSGQKLLHLGLLLAALMVLPIHIPEKAMASIPWGSNPVLWLLGCLLSVVGLPFFVISSSAPILQKWFSQTDHPQAGDPYFLYAASNLGSLLALLAYPFLIEPHLRLLQQSWIWSILYGALIGLFAICGVVVWKTDAVSKEGNRNRIVQPEESEERQQLSRQALPRQRAFWVLLAFIPSSLMLGVTNHLSTDIAAIPLLWVAPLAIYLLTFILAFSKLRLVPERGLDRAVAIGTLSLLYVILSHATQPITLLVLVHFAVFFILGFFCHRRLADSRPSTSHLTEFYLWISVGGVLGGLFNALLAPTIFQTVIEYPLMLVLACFARRKEGAASETKGGRWLDTVLPLGVFGLTALLAARLPQATTFNFQAQVAVIFGIPLIISYILVERPLRFGLAMAAVLAASWFYIGPYGRTLHLERNFFGVARVTIDPDANMKRLVHGTTIHGKQFVIPERQCEPLSYYHRTGPIAQVFQVFRSGHAPRRVAITGLGAGSMAAYSRPDEAWTYYEIDPAVIRIAQNTNYFTFLRPCAAAPISIVPGDARLRLREAPEHGYGLIVMDAFSSDSIPTHLLTREALKLYLSKLAEGGILAFHISNRYLDLKPVLADLAANAGLVCLYRNDFEVTAAETVSGKDPSEWLVMARESSDLGQLSLRASIWAKLASEPDWQPVNGNKDAKVWSDDFSNLLSTVKWR